MTSPRSVLPDYYAAIDDGRLQDAVALLDESVTFAMHLPSGTRRGEGREAMMEYLSRRPPVERRHHVLRSSAEDGLEFAYGKVTDDGAVTGYFLSAVALDVHGHIASYQVTFDVELGLLP